MIRRSDNRAANALFARVGAASVNAVARRAGMTNFRLVQRKQTADGYVLGYSQVSAVDQARLFARIEDLAAARHRAFAMAQLESIEGAGRFGILDSGINAVIRSKGGWRPESDGGWTVNQAAQVTIGGQTYGFAVVLGRQHTFEAGAAAIASVARAAFSGGDAGVAGGGCDEAAPPLSSDTGERIGEIARRYLGKDARRQTFTGFRPSSTSLAWCAWFTTNVWRMAGVPVEVSWFSGYHYTWADGEQDAVQGPWLTAARIDTAGGIGTDVRQRAAEHEYVAARQSRRRRQSRRDVHAHRRQPGLKPRHAPRPLPTGRCGPREVERPGL